MSTEPPHLASDLVLIHKVITRALDVCLIKGREYQQRGFVNPQAQPGYSSYTHSLVSVLSAHHLAEEEIAFPALRKSMPSVPYDQLEKDHHEIQLLLELMPVAITALSIDPEKALSSIINTLHKVSNVWMRHFPLEEENFTAEALTSLMSPEEQRWLSEAMSNYSQEHTNPAYWIVPFVLYNLTQPDRAIMAGYLPPVVLNELIPKVWADQWAPMKPLLLV